MSFLTIIENKLNYFIRTNKDCILLDVLDLNTITESTENTGTSATNSVPSSSLNSHITVENAETESPETTMDNATSNKDTLPEKLNSQLNIDDKVRDDNEHNEKGATALPDGEDEEKAPLQSVYHVKWINFKDNHVAIVTQNENGPCPLLAITNVLLLQGKIKLPGMVEMVTSGQLMEYLGDFIFTNMPKVKLNCELKKLYLMCSINL